MVLTVYNYGIIAFCYSLSKYLFRCNTYSPVASSSRNFLISLSKTSMLCNGKILTPIFVYSAKSEVFVLFSSIFVTRMISLHVMNFANDGW